MQVHSVLNKDSVIGDDADFVFYNSEHRSEVNHLKETNTATNVWKSKTHPMSADGSVMGSIDDLGDDDEGKMQMRKCMSIWTKLMVK